MSRSFVWFLASLATLSGCSKAGNGLVVVVVDAAQPVANIAALHTKASIGGHTVEFDVKGPSSPFSLPPSETFGIDVPAAYSGIMMVHVDALDGATPPAVLASGDGQVMVAAGARRNLQITLASGGGGDGGSGDGSGGGDAGDGGASPIHLNAIHPSLASAGETLLLEGRFGAGATVTFPGGTVAPATVLGPERATVVVPSSATAGDLTVSSDGATSAPVAFRRTSFLPAVQTFQPWYEQSSVARQAPKMVSPRSAHASAVVGSFLYLFGGARSSDGQTQGTVERALLDADGTLGPFVDGGITLVTRRAHHAALALGNRVYVIGGDNPTAVGSVETATVGADGTLGAFADAGVALKAPRTAHAAVVIGGSLYVIGGSDGSQTPLQSLERAPILGDGTLGAFAPVPSVMLTVPRSAASAVVVGSWLYVLGGSNNGGALKSVDRAPINPDGTLGAFVDAGVTLTQTRSSFAAAVIGRAVYTFGGLNASTALKDIDQAPINSDGTLGPFAAAAQPLYSARSAPTSEVVGNYVYVLGGPTGVAVDAEHASINGTGGLGTFATTPGVTLPPTYGLAASTFALGNYVYLIGGITASSPTASAPTFRTTVLRAPVNADGTLGTFADAGTALTVARYNPVVLVIGSTVYVAAGLGASSGGKSIERAQFDSHGVLGPFIDAGAGVTIPIGIAETHAVVLGNSAYLLGGRADGTGAVATIEQAAIDAQGTLGSFSAVDAATNALALARRGHGVIVTRLYVSTIGGSLDNANTTATSDWATYGPDGSLNKFSGGPSYLALANYYHTSLIIGGFYYVVGGLVRTPQRTQLSTDGNYGALAPVYTSSTVAVRQDSGAIAIGNYVYLIGGWIAPEYGAGSSWSPTSPIGTVERAELQ
jgi:hypothetical protein